MSGRAACLALVSLVTVVALAAAWPRGERAPDLSGRWRFANPDAGGRPAFPLCAVSIAQDGDRANVTATAADGGAWSCTGRGEIAGATLRFRWAGAGKGWRGTATFTLEADGAIRGTYRREDAASENLRCVGVREAGAPR